MMKQKEVVPADDRWVEKNIRQFTGTPSERISSEWMLVSAGDVSRDKSNWNTMTASWGGLGVLWGRDAAFMFIRPSRHTFQFANSSDLFSLSFFDAKYRKSLDICGSKSGRDTDKAAEAGITPVVFDRGAAAGAVGFKEASDIIVCRKLYTHDFDPRKFLSAAIENNYNGQDYHRMFIGEILVLLSRA